MEKSFPVALLSALILFFAATLILSQHLRDHPATDQFLVPPPEYIEHFAFGFNESMADSFWLRWIQDSDNCQTYGHAPEKLEALPIDKRAQTEFYDPRHKVCDGSWAFKMLDTVTKLAPKFRMAYVGGGIALAVLTEDYTGATALFNRGVENYPDDWDLLYRASYHFMFDTKDKARAAELLSRAGDHGAPPWVKSLAARLYSQSGQLELGLRTLVAYRNGLPANANGLKELDKRIAEMKRQLAQVPKGP